MNDGGIIRGHDLFQSLGLDDAHGLSDFSFTRRFEANEVIFRFGDKAEQIFMLLSGSVELRLPNDPQDLSLVISRIEKGELFGLSPMLNSTLYTATAFCREPTEVLSIDATPLREMLLKNHMVGFNFMNQVALIYFNRYIAVLNSVQKAIGEIALTH